MAKRKENRVDLVSTESHHRRPAEKSSAKKSVKMELMMYDPIVRKHVKYVEKKQARSS